MAPVLLACPQASPLHFCDSAGMISGEKGQKKPSLAGDLEKATGQEADPLVPRTPVPTGLYTVPRGRAQRLWLRLGPPPGPVLNMSAGLLSPSQHCPPSPALSLLGLQQDLVLSSGGHVRGWRPRRGI